MKKLLAVLVFFLSFNLSAQALFDREKRISRRDKEGRVAVNPAALTFEKFYVHIDGKKYEARAEEIEDGGNDVVSRFRIGNAPTSTITYWYGQMAGEINLEDGRNFRLIPVPEGHILSEVTDFSFECRAVNPETVPGFNVSENSVSSGRTRPVRHPGPEKFIVTLAEFYTPAAEKDAGGRLQAEARIKNAVDVLNTVVKNSGINNLEYRLSYMGLLNVVEAGDILYDFSQNSEVARIRTETKSDLAGLWTENHGAEAIIAMAYDPSWGFHSQWIGSAPITFAHEVGHNHGLQHDLANAHNIEGDPAPYARGWYDCMAGWATVMTYYNQVCKNLSVPEPKRIPYFSNPDVKYNGIPTGVRDKADNAKLLRYSIPFVAQYLN